jgi:phage tail sheath gpL-like
MPTITFSEAIGGPVPMVEIEINLTGAGGLADGEQIRSIIVIAERVAAATGTADTISSTAFGSRDDGIAWFGTTSPGACMVAAIYDYYNSDSGGAKAEIWGAQIAEKATGTAPIQTLTITNNNTAAGVLTLRIGGHVFTIPISNATSVGDQATLIRDAFNNADEADRPPLVATAAAGPPGVVTFTGSVKCAHMNNIALETVSQGSIATTTYVWSDTTMGGAGGTPGVGGYAAGDFTAILAALVNFTDAGQYVIPWTENGNAAGQVFDTAVPTTLRAHLITKANATNMIPTSLRMAWKTTTTLSIAAVAALDTNDCERVSLVVPPYSATGDSGTWEGEIAARYAAMRASERHFGRPFDGLAFSGVAVPAAADNWTRAEQKTLLEGGCTPLAVPPMGDTMRMVRDVACRMDFGVLDTNAMDVLDYIRLDFQQALAAQSRMMIVDDDADMPLVEFCTQPKQVKALLRSRADLLAKEGYMTNVATNWANVTTNLSGSTLQIAIPVDLIPALHNIMTRLDAVVPPGA